MRLMKVLSLFVICSLWTSCKNPPPDVTPCLIDLQVGVAHCSPVNTKKKPYDLPINQMNKYWAMSNSDFGTLLQWINIHENQ